MSRTTSDRLAVKTLDQRFRYELETGSEMAPRTAQGILEAAKSAFSLDAVTGHQNGRLHPGQIRQVIAAVGAPHGRPLRETEMAEVIWTIKAGEEDQKVPKEQERRDCAGYVFCACWTKPWHKAASRLRRIWARR